MPGRGRVPWAGAGASSAGRATCAEACCGSEFQISRKRHTVSRGSRTTWDAIRAAGSLPQDAHLRALAEGLIAGATITPEAIVAPGEPTRVRHAAMARALLDACVQACATLTSGAPSPRLLDRVPGLGEARARERSSRVRGALGAAAMAWSMLPEQERLVIARLAQGHWAGAIEAVITEPRASVRASIAILAGEAQDAALAEALAILISDANAEVGEHAERAMVSLAAGIPEEARVRAAAVAAAGNVGSHHRRGAVLAFAAVADRIAMRAQANEAWAAGARAILRDEAARDRKADAGANEAVRAMLRFSRTAAASERAVEWLRIESVSRACVDRLTRPRVRSDHSAVLAGAHLLEHPARARALRAVRLPAIRAARNGESAILPLDLPEHDEDARANAPRIAGLVKASDADLTAWLEPLLTDPSPRVRLMLAQRAPLALRQDLVHDAHPLVARAAALRLSRVGTMGDVRATARVGSPSSDGDVFHGAGRSSHAGLRAAASDERACFGGGGVEWRLAWRQHFEADRDACIAQIASMLRQSGLVLNDGIELVRTLGLATRLHEALSEVLVGAKATPRQAATTVALLGQADPARTTAAARSIAGALGHDDARVRSNAIEAIAHRARHASASPATEAAIASQSVPAIGPLLAPLFEDAHHRVRATLARAVLLRDIDAAPVVGDASAIASAAGGTEPTAVEVTPKVAQAVLVEMLMGAQPLDRLAGVWAAGRIVLATSGASLARAARAGAHPAGAGAPLLQARLAEIARFDVEPKVRWRAACIIERLEGELRAAWSGPVTMGSDPMREPDGANA